MGWLETKLKSVNTDKWYLLLVPTLFYFVLLVLGKNGIGITPDSVSYLSAMRSLLEGRGYLMATATGGEAFMAHFPPIFPIFLFLVGGLYQIQRMVVVNALLGAVSVYLLGRVWEIVLGISNRNRFFTVVLQGLLAISADFMYIHVHLWSEPLFVAVMLLAIYLIVKDWQRPTTTAIVAIMALLPLIRYAGILFVVAYVGLIIARAVIQHSSKIEVVKKTVWAVLPLVPFTLWNVFTAILGTSTRSLGFHMISVDKMKRGISVVWGWWLPQIDTLSYVWKSLFLLVLIIGGMYIINQYTQEQNNMSGSLHKEKVLALPYLYALIPLYVCFIVVTICFLDQATRLNSRMLAPILPISLLFLVQCGAIVTVKNKMVGVTLIGIIVVAIGTRGYIFAKQLLQFGAENSRIQWENSPVLSYSCNQLKGKLIITNAREVLYAYCGGENSIDVDSLNIATLKDLPLNITTNYIVLANDRKNGEKAILLPSVSINTISQTEFEDGVVLQIKPLE